MEREVSINTQERCLVTAIAAAEQSVGAHIAAYIANCVPDAGAVLCRCPLFKAGKPITTYASARDALHPDADNAWKEVVVTTNFTVKLQITQKDPAKVGAGKAAVKIVTEWVSPLTSVVGVVPYVPTAGEGGDGSNGGTAPAAAANQASSTSSRTRNNAIFSVLFLLAKSAKADKPGAVNYRDAALRAGGHQLGAGATQPPGGMVRTASVANSAEAMSAEEKHLSHLHTLSNPSLRCRTYVVPEVLGGAATRDKWVAAYNDAVAASWRRRLERVVPTNATNEIACVRFAEATHAIVAPPGGAGSCDGAALASVNVLCSVIVFADKTVMVVPVADGGVLQCTSRCLTESVQRHARVIAAPLTVQRPSEYAPFRLNIEKGGQAVVSLSFFATAHADAFWDVME